MPTKSTSKLGKWNRWDPYQESNFKNRIAVRRLFPDWFSRRSRRLGRLPQTLQMLLEYSDPILRPVCAMARPRSQFRPCIDLHEGKVKQIVGSTIEQSDFQENFVSEKPSSWFAEKFRDDALCGGHVIKLGPGNDQAALDALAVWPGGLQVGGGITIDNGQSWIDAGASHVIVTSWLFDGLNLDWERVRSLAKEIGSCRIVIDLSCRRTANGWSVATNRWQTLTEVDLTVEILERLAPYCNEFLIHAADVEGKCGGIDIELVKLLSDFETRKVTYAGGVASMDDLMQIDEASQGKLDVTVGSALDLFGGQGMRYQELISWNCAEATSGEA